MSYDLPNLILNNVRTKSAELIFRNIGNKAISLKYANGVFAENGRLCDWSSSATTLSYVSNSTFLNPLPDSAPSKPIKVHNVRYINKLYSASKTHDWASVAAGAVANTTITLTGAVLGDTVVASMNIALNGLRLWAEVTATNVVTFYLHNPTAAAVDLPSGTLTVKLL